MVLILLELGACKVCLVGEGVSVIATLIRLLESGTSMRKEKDSYDSIGIDYCEWGPIWIIFSRSSFAGNYVVINVLSALLYLLTT